MALTKPAPDRWVGLLSGLGPWLRALLAVEGPRMIGPVLRRSHRSAAITPQKRRVQLDGVELAYTLILCRRKSLGLRVGPHGLTVRAPSGMLPGEVTRLLKTKARWILRHMLVHQSREIAKAKNFAPGPDGGQFRYLGESLAWVCDASRPAGAHQLRAGEIASVLCLALPAAAGPDQARAAIGAWLREQALVYFGQRLAGFAAQMGVHYTRLALSNASTRWGSANRQGVIRLNWRLMHLAPEIVDYVVVHELAHLRFMHHGPAFWQCVAQVLPDFKARRQRLRGEVLDEEPC